MSRGAPPAGPTYRLLPTIAWGATMVLVGLLADVPAFGGPALALLGVIGSVYLRSRAAGRSVGWEGVPALIALAVLVVTAPIGPGTELFAGLAALGFLWWLSDDPTRGAPRRTVPVVGLVALAFGLAWGVAVAVRPTSSDPGLAGAVAALALVLVALVLVRGVLERPSETV